MIPVTQTWLKLGVGCLCPPPPPPPIPWEYRISVAPVQGYILGMDILWELILQTNVGEFRLWIRSISVWVT